MNHGPIIYVCCAFCFFVIITASIASSLLPLYPLFYLLSSLICPPLLRYLRYVVVIACTVVDLDTYSTHLV
jgi:hypothetical protein